MKRFLSAFLCLAGLQVHANLASAFQTWTNAHPGAKFVAFFGDSIVAGYPNFDPGFPSWTPTGVADGNVAHRLQVDGGNALTATNYGVNGALAAFCDNMAGTFVGSRPKYAILKVGYNNLTGTPTPTWTDLAPFWNSIRSKCVAGNSILVACAIWPSANISPLVQSNYNYSLKTWTTTNGGGTIFLDTHDWMASGTNLYVMNPAWTVDQVHPSLAGTEREAQLILTTLSALEGGQATNPPPPPSSQGHTVTAQNVSWTAVKAAYDSATDGDTIVIPAGTADWTKQLKIAKAVTLQGAGIGATIITDSITTSPLGLFDITLVPNQTTRITGIEFRPGSTTVADPVAKVLGANTDNSRFRFDHCKFDNLYNSAVRLNTVLGVYDHNILNGRAGYNTLAHVKCSYWDGKANGSGAWDDSGPNFGSQNFFFFEDNVCTGTSMVNYTSLIDAQAGGRYVFRHNTVLRGYVEGHGSEATYERSTHAVEVYNNTFDQGNIMGLVTYFRGGSGLVYSNAISNVQGSTHPFSLLHNRMDDSEFPPYGGADGRNHWDVNDPQNPFDTATCTSAGSLTVTAGAKSWTANQWAGYTIRRTSGKAVTSLIRNGTTITVNCPAHGFSTGNYVSLFGANQQEYNYGYSITVTDPNTFTATTGEALPPTPATGTIKACLGNYFSEIAANTGTQITFHDSVFGASRTLTFAIGDTFEINKVTHGMDQIGRTGGSLIDSTATPAFPAGWNNQTTSPWYQWDNNAGSTKGVLFGTASKSIVSGVHFFDNTMKPGYVPFTYPHPLISGSTNIIVPLTPPRNIRLLPPP